MRQVKMLQIWGCMMGKRKYIITYSDDPDFEELKSFLNNSKNFTHMNDNDGAYTHIYAFVGEVIGGTKK